MKIKSSHIFMAAVLALAGYTYVFEYRKSLTDIEKKEAEKQIFSLSKDKVDQIYVSVSSANGLVSEVELKRKGTEWSVVKPFEEFADSNEIMDWLNSLYSEKAIEFVKADGQPIQWPSYALDKPKFKIVIFGSGVSQTLEISEKRNFEGNSFIRRDGATDLMIGSANWAGLADKSIKDFRDKRILRRETLGLSSVEIKSQDKVVLQNENGVWGLKQSTDISLAQDSVMALINTLKEIRAVDFETQIPATAAELKKYQMNKPNIVVDFGFKDGTHWKGLFSKDSSNTWFGTSEDQPKIMKIQSTQMEKIFNANVEGLRNKTEAFFFNPEKISRIILRDNRDLEIKKNNGGWSWNQKTELDSSEVPILIRDLSTLRVSQFFDGKKQWDKNDKVERTVELYDDSNQMILKLEFSKIVTKDKVEFVLVRSSNYKDIVGIEKLSYINLGFDKLEKPTKPKS